MKTSRVARVLKGFLHPWRKPDPPEKDPVPRAELSLGQWSRS